MLKFKQIVLNYLTLGHNPFCFFRKIKNVLSYSRITDTIDEMTRDPITLAHTPLGGNMSALKVGASKQEQVKGKNTVIVSSSDSKLELLTYQRRCISFSKNKNAISKQSREAASASHRIKNLSFHLLCHYHNSFLLPNSYKTVAEPLGHQLGGLGRSCLSEILI